KSNYSVYAIQNKQIAQVFGRIQSVSLQKDRKLPPDKEGSAREEQLFCYVDCPAKGEIERDSRFGFGAP
ncbi:MAG: hypothetical protein ACI9NG_002664, partial [Hyphomonas sp.]